MEWKYSLRHEDRSFNTFKKKFRLILYVIIVSLVLWILADQVVKYQTHDSEVRRFQYLTLNHK